MTNVEATSRPKRSYDPQLVRTRILDAAASAYQSNGYHSTSMHDVMRLTGLSGGALYHHFPTKKALGLAVIRERVSRGVANTWIEPLRSSEGTARALRRVFDDVIGDLDERVTVRGCPLTNLALELSLADPEFREAVHAIFEGWRSAIAERVHADQSRGALAHLDAGDFATFVVALFSGAMGLAKAAQNTAPLKSCVREIERVMATAT
jgi:AcrR family transcriptional regulator